MSELDDLEEIDISYHSECSFKQREAAKKCVAKGRKRPMWKRQLAARKAYITKASHA